MSETRDQLRLALACDALCAPLCLGPLWLDGQPTSKADHLRALKRLDARTKTLVHLAWSVWNGGGFATVNDLLGLEPADVRSFCGLLVAIADGGGALAEWTEMQLERAARELEARRTGT